MKKITNLLLLLATLGSIASCGSTSTNNKEESGDVVLSFLYGYNLQGGMSAVEEKLNEYCKEKYNFGIKFKALGIFDQDGVYTNWLGANEEIDILNVALTDPMQYITEKRCMCINDYFNEEVCPDLYAKISTKPASQTIGLDGKLYGIGTVELEDTLGNSYCVRKDVLEACGLYGEGEGKYLDQEYITYDELDYIFEAIKSNPNTNKTSLGANVYPCGIVGSNDPTGYLMAMDPVGSKDKLTGFTMNPITGEWDETVKSLYETAEYKETVERLGRWNAKGYIHPDADVTANTVSDFMNNGQFCGVFLTNFKALADQFLPQIESNLGIKTEMVQLLLTKPFFYSSTPSINYMINSKSKRPQRAMKVIEMIMCDKYVANLLQYGIENEHYELVDEEHGFIYVNPEGNYSLPGVWGDKNLVYRTVSSKENLEEEISKTLKNVEIDAAKAQYARDHISPSAGFIYDNSKMKVRIKNITASVVSKYSITLSCGKGKIGTDGTYTGPGSTYASFVEALQKNKINLIVEDKAEQYAAWKASK